jgi:hypothetical protein
MKLEIFLICVNNAFGTEIVVNCAFAWTVNSFRSYHLVFGVFSILIEPESLRIVSPLLVKRNLKVKFESVDFGLFSPFVPFLTFLYLKLHLLAFARLF